MFYPMARAKCARSLPYSKKWSKMKFLEHLSWRTARAGVRARQKKISDSKTSIKIDAFWLLDRCHSSKTRRDSECWSLMKNWKSKFSLAMTDTSKMSFLAFFSILSKYIELRAQKFGARQWIQNRKTNTFRIYNMSISFKFMEIEGFEVWSQRRIFVKFQEKRAPLKFWNVKILIFNFHQTSTFSIFTSFGAMAMIQ